jgi:hypothetical protein
VTAAFWPWVAYAGPRETLTTKLKEYCIPSSRCEFPHVAGYDTTQTGANKCRCACADMYYDAGARQCEICDVTTVGYNATTCGAQSCGIGYALQERISASGKCAAGFILKDLEWNCATGVGPGRCDPGYKWVDGNYAA